MTIRLIDVLPMPRVSHLAQALEDDQMIHEWKPDRLLMAFAHKIDPLWFHQGHLYDLFRFLRVDEEGIKTALPLLVDQRILISDSCPSPRYLSHFGGYYQVLYCYRLERTAGLAYEKQLANFKASSQAEKDPVQPATTEVLPAAVVNNTRGYVEEVVLQANGCYENRWFDACSVMIRKLVEMLIIAVYEKEGRQQDIRGSDGNYRHFSLIATISLPIHAATSTASCLRSGVVGSFAPAIIVAAAAVTGDGGTILNLGRRRRHIRSMTKMTKRTTACGVRQR